MVRPTETVYCSTPVRLNGTQIEAILNMEDEQFRLFVLELDSMRCKVKSWKRNKQQLELTYTNL